MADENVLNLEKGAAPTNLSEQFPNLTSSMLIGLGWDPADTGADFDLDSCVVLLDANKKIIPDGIVFFNHLEFKNGGEVAIKHNGDDLTGGNSDTGPDETINVYLKKLPAEVAHVVPFMNIFKASERNQKFGQVNNSFMVLIDGSSEKEVIRHSLKKEYAENTGVVMADIYRFGEEWKVKALGVGVDGDIQTISDKIPSLL
jgi:tellurium resistance protein TerD